MYRKNAHVSGKNVDIYGKDVDEEGMGGEKM